MKKITYIIIFLFSITAHAQNWIPANIPLSVKQIRTFCTDTVNNKIYVAGAITLDGSGNYYLNSICIYDGLAWTQLDTINDLIKTMVVYNGELIVGGDFPGVNGQSMPYLIKWNGSNWQHIGGNINSSVSKLRVINNELYVIGNFTQIGGISANYVAKWDGATWSDFNNLPAFGVFVNDIAFYNNEWYIGGNFTMSNGIKDIAVFNGSSWQKVGNNDTLRGSFTGIEDMEIYNNELCIGGLILKSEGNIGNGIQKWNGTVWSEVGTGVQDFLNGYSSNVQIHDLYAQNGKLYAGGTFYYAGNIPAKRYAIWDGNKWCGVGTDFGQLGIVTTIHSFNDTIWIGGMDSLDGTYVNKVAKWIGGNSTDTCSIMSTSEISKFSFQIDIYPNPAFDNVTIDIYPVSRKGSSMFTLLDVNGSVIWKYSIQDSENKITIPLNSFSRGVYFIRYSDSEVSLIRKLIKL